MSKHAMGCGAVAAGSGRRGEKRWDRVALEPLEGRRLLSAGAAAAAALDLTAFVASSTLPPSVAAGRTHGSAVVRVTSAGGGLPFPRGAAVQLYLRPDGEADSANDVPVGNPTMVRGLRAGVARGVRIGFGVPDGLEGSYRLVALVDPADRVGETDETNNETTGSDVYAVGAPFTDLGIVNMGYSFNGPLYPGDDGTMTIVVGNNGNTPARGAIRFAYGLFNSGERHPIFIRQPLRAVSLRPGETRTYTLSVRVPANTPPGDYDVSGGFTSLAGDIAPDNNDLSFPPPPLTVTPIPPPVVLTDFVPSQHLVSAFGLMHEEGTATGPGGIQVTYDYTYLSGTVEWLIKDDVSGFLFFSNKVRFFCGRPGTFQGKTLTFLNSAAGATGLARIQLQGETFPVGVQYFRLV